MILVLPIFYSHHSVVNPYLLIHQFTRPTFEHTINDILIFKQAKISCFCLLYVSTLECLSEKHVNLAWFSLIPLFLLRISRLVMACNQEICSHHPHFFFFKVLKLKSKNKICILMLYQGSTFSSKWSGTFISSRFWKILATIWYRCPEDVFF